MSPRSAQKTMQAPVLVIGPWSRGRSYGVVRASPGGEAGRADQALLDDFALSLSSWAKRQAGGFVAAFALPAGGFALVRARHMGEADLGPVALAAVVRIGADQAAAAGGRLHRLLGQVPDPADPETGLAPVTLDPGAGFPGDSIADPGLAWHDQFITVRSDPEAALQALLEGLTPEAQRPRIDGWASTGALPPAGQFDPWKLFRLIVHEGAPPPAGSLPSHAIGSVASGRLSMAPVPPPTAWAAWSALHADPRTRVATDAAPWNPGWADTPAADVVAFATIAACKTLNAAGRVALLLAVAELAERAEPGLQQGLEGGFNETLGALMRAADPARAAGYVKALAERPQAYTPVIEHGIGVAAADATARLPEPAVRRFAAGIAAGLAAKADGAGLDGAGAPLLAILLPAAARAAGDSPDARRFAARLTAAAATAGVPDAAETLAALLALPPDPADQELAAPAVMALALDRAPALWPALSARAVRPALADTRDAARFRAALAAALLAEARGSAA